MDRIAAGAAIAIATLAMSAGMSQDVLARDTPPQSAAPAAIAPTATRILGLLVTIEALRGTPAVLELGKSGPIGL